MNAVIGIRNPLGNIEVKQPNVVAEPQEEYVPRTEEEILAGLREALHEVKLHKEGKIKLTPVKEFLAEL